MTGDANGLSTWVLDSSVNNVLISLFLLSEYYFVHILLALMNWYRSSLAPVGGPVRALKVRGKYTRDASFHRRAFTSRFQALNRGVSIS